MNGTESKVVACHQPNFLPWMGYFAKMFHADVFILLDDVQFTQGHNKHNWTTRVRILTASGPLWLTVPVRRSGRGKQVLRDVQINVSDPKWVRKILRTLECTYQKATYFDQYYPALRRIFEQHHTSIVELNIRLLRWAADILKIPTPLHLSSHFQVRGSSNQRLIELTRAVAGTIYLSGDGADDYQVREEFEQHKIELQKMGFAHPVYPQLHSAEFVPGLSSIDALFSIGAEAVHALLANARTDSAYAYPPIKPGS
jgi:hypothetical protein